MSESNLMPGDLIVVWFSCGAASAVAAKKTIEQYGDICNIRIVNHPIREEHEDNLRFLKDVEKWLGIPIESSVNAKWPNASAEEVWIQERFMAGPFGALCTRALKRRAGAQWEEENKPDWCVLGFTYDEIARHERFRLMERGNILPVLIDLKLRKQDCYNLLISEGIMPPLVYQLGYPNANCIGCVKASSPTYWNLVRKTHPDVFERRARLSRELNVRLVKVKGKKIFLDELLPNINGRSLNKMTIECGIFCDMNETIESMIKRGDKLTYKP